MTRGQGFEQNGKGKTNLCSPISNSAWCNLSSKGEILKLHEMCPYHKSKSQKQIVFTPRQFQIERVGFKTDYTDFSKPLQLLGILF